MRVGSRLLVALGASFVAVVALYASSAYAASITSFIPADGIADQPGVCAGSVVVITGSGFSAGTSAVTFGGGKSASFKIGSDTTLYAIVPSGASTGAISVTTSAGTATTSTPFTIDPCWGADAGVHPAAAPPVKATLTSYTPLRAKSGAKLTITGSNFIGAKSVKIGGAKAAFSILSDTQIVATVPAAAKSGKITVTNSAGSASAAIAFTKG